MNVLRFVKRFRKQDSGSATIESVLWLPLFVVFFVMVADVSMVFHRQTQVLRIVQDANRSLSVGRFKTTVQTENYVKTALNKLSPSVQATTTVSGGIITTRALVPVKDMVAVGMFTFLTGYNVGVSSQQFLEY